MAEFVNPDKERFSQFRDRNTDGVIHMLNLIRLRDTAVYPDGTRVSGKEAYAAYGRESAAIFKRVGGQIVWSADYAMNLIGPEEDYWDIMFIAEYPSVDAFVQMIKDPEYQKAVVHRTAAVKDSRLVRTHPKENAKGFG